MTKQARKQKQVEINEIETQDKVKRNASGPALRRFLTGAGHDVPRGTTRAAMLALADSLNLTAHGNVVSDAWRQTHKGGSCGDELAAALTEAVGTPVSKEAVVEIAKQNGIDANRWAHLNPGQQRMNLGNVLRAKARRGKQVVIGNVTFSAE